MTNLYVSVFVLYFYFKHVAGTGNLSFTFPPQTDIRLYPGLDAYFEGDIMELTKNQANGDLQSSTGWATYNKSIPLWNNSSQSLANFTTHFQFIISRISTWTGDGLTFFMAPFDAEPPENAPGKWLGLFNETIDGNSSNQIVAVEFDTFQNAPYDPDGNHVGINVNGIVSKAIFSLSNNDNDSPNLKNGNYWDAWVDYNGVTKQLQVFLMNNPSGNSSNITKPAKPKLQYDIDLRQILPENIKVGFSASTGLSIETHTIYEWSFSCEYSLGPRSSSRSFVKSHAKVIFIISLSAIAAFACGLLCAGGQWYLSKTKGGEESDVELDQRFSQGPRKFSYAELCAATRNFSDSEKLGQGGFGWVYRGVLAGTKKIVAVKRISQGSQQGKKEYVSEVSIISKVRHRNLVQLIGWCHEKTELLLVYEYLPNGSLDKYLLGNQKGMSLDWERRYSIACDIASALVYLHEEWDQRVVHRDVKASNVMLDSKFNAKLGDFGLARIVDRDLSVAHTTVVAGTMGYMAPEYVLTGKASPESDAYSFGAVAIVIACGRSPVDRSLDGHKIVLVEWVWDLHREGKLLDAADQSLNGNFDGEEMERLMLVGLLCSHPDPKTRLTMREAVKILKFESPLPHVPLKFPVAVYSDTFDQLGSSSMERISKSVPSSPKAVQNASVSALSTQSSISTGDVTRSLFYEEGR